MKIILLFVMLVIMTSGLLHAQHEADNWYFGYRVGMSFQGGIPKKVTDGTTNNLEGCATLSDPKTGELLFYTDGVNVWNKNHQIMLNGKKLNGGTSCTQSALIVPHPGNKLLYYIFTAPDLTDLEIKNTNLCYSVVSLENPLGEVITKNTVLMGGVSEKLTGTLDCKGQGYWVVSHHKSSGTFYAFHVTDAGVSPTPVTSSYYTEISDFVAGYIKISPDRNRLALASSAGYLAVFDFNVQTGEVSNPLRLNEITQKNTYYGVSFSPDNTKLYVSDFSSSLFQYDLSLPTVAQIRSSMYITKSGLKIGALQLGPDGKLYACQSGYGIKEVQNVSVVNEPNLKGRYSDVDPYGVQLSGQVMVGLPNFMDYIFNSDKTVIARHPKCLPPRAKADSAVGCVGKPVVFTDKSGVYPSFREWVFEGGSPGFSSDSIATVLYSKAGKYDVRLIIGTDNGFDTVHTSAMMYPSPRAFAGADRTVCGGGMVVQLGAPPVSGTSYLWYPADNLDDPHSAQPRCSISATTTYTLTAMNGYCVDTASVTITVKPFEGANAGTDKTICPGATALIGSPPETGNVYAWSPAKGLSNAASATPLASPDVTTQYILTVTNPDGCLAHDTVMITVGAIIAEVSGDTAVCEGTSAQLFARGGTEYRWTPSDGLNDSTIENPIAFPRATTIYTVVISSGSCIDTAHVTVTVIPSPIAQAGKDVAICTGAGAVLGDSTRGGYSYRWQPASGLDDATKASPKATPTVTTQYILTVHNSSGCSANDTVIVTVGALQAIVSADTTLCMNSSVRLEAQGGTDYRWSPSEGLSNPFVANPIASPIVTTTYTVHVSSGECRDSASVTITVMPLPVAAAGADTTVCKGETARLGRDAVSGNIYFWTPAEGLSSPNQSRTFATPQVTTTYIQHVVNANGCSSEDTVEVKVEPVNERSFSLAPKMLELQPGQRLQATLHVPPDVAEWSVRLDYDPQWLNLQSIVPRNNGSVRRTTTKAGQVMIDGIGENTDIDVEFDTYLPTTADQQSLLRLTVDSAGMVGCYQATATGAMVVLADYCARQIRAVEGTGKKYYLTVNDRSIDFGVGLTGNVRLEVFDYVGNSVLVVSDGALEAGEYSAGLDLPVGVYYCRMSAGMYESVGKVLIAR